MDWRPVNHNRGSRNPRRMFRDKDGFAGFPDRAFLGCGSGIALLFVIFVIIIIATQFARYKACVGMGGTHDECVYRVLTPVYYGEEW